MNAADALKTTMSTAKAMTGAQAVVGMAPLVGSPPWTPQLGGNRPYLVRLGKDRSQRHNRRSIASAKWASPPGAVLRCSHMRRSRDAERELQVSRTLDLCCTRLRGAVEVGSAYRRAEPFLADHCASAASSARASAISGISGVGAKPSSAGASMARASAGRAADW